MNLCLLISLACLTSPSGLGDASVSPATVLARETLFATDFELPRGAAGFTLPKRGTELVTSPTAWLRLSPEPRRPALAWLPLPTARGRYLRVSGRLRSNGGAATLQFAAVSGTQTPAAAPFTARWWLAAPADWSAFEHLLRMPAAADVLAFGVEGAAALELDDLVVVRETRQRDAVLDRLATATGNRLDNGGFEAGSTGFRAVMVHDSIARSEPPAVGLLRVSDKDAKEGRRLGQLFVVDGPVHLTLAPVVLPGSQTFTFSFWARVRAPQPGRVAVQLEDDLGVAHGRKESAVGADWERYQTSVTTPAGDGVLRLPRIIGFPAATPYTLELDGLTLREGESADDTASPRPVLALSDNLREAIGFGHLAAPGEPVRLTARLTAGSEPVTATLETVIESQLGAVTTPLPAARASASPEVTAEIKLVEQAFEPGWYRVRATLTDGAATLAEASQTFAVVEPPAADGWRLAVRWTTPDLLLRGPLRGMLLGRLPWLQVTDRWLDPNAAAVWAALEPRPGELSPAPLTTSLEASRAAKLGTLVELDPWPQSATAPQWLASTAPTASGRRVPAPHVWQRYVEALAAATVELPVTWLVAAAPAELESVRADWVELTAAALRHGQPTAAVEARDDWFALPALPSGALAPDWIEMSPEVIEADPFAVEAARATALLTAAAAGRRRFLWPDQGLAPHGYDAVAPTGLTATDGGPRPLVAVMSTLRREVGDRPGRGVRARGDLRIAWFGDAEPRLAVWSVAAPVSLELPAAGVTVRRATGEALDLPANAERQVTVSRWPVWLQGQTAAEAARWLALLGAGQD